MTDTITTPISLPLSLNTAIIDKNAGGNKLNFVHGWEQKNLTLNELAEAINEGFAFGPQFRDDHRLGANFETCGFIAIDSDGSLPLADALADPFINKFGTLWYTTPSHGIDGEDRFRVVFVTETPVPSAEQYRAALLGLALRFNTDTKIADAARFFYGSRDSNPTIIGNVLPAKELKALVKEGREAAQNRRFNKVSFTDTLGKEQVVEGSVRASEIISSDLPILLAHGGSATIRNIPPQTAVHCPFHTDAHPSAFTLLSKMGDPGVHCMACRKTWWAEQPPKSTYNFYHYDDVVMEMASRPNNVPQGNEYAVVINERFLADIEPRDGITLIKSPKGTGKTSALGKLVADAKKNGLSVLLIGHRQVLLRELAARLGLECYLDDENLGGEYGTPRPDYYAISVDSLPRRLRLPRPYDVVIVDECEQVFRHVTAKTVKDPYAVMTRLQSYIAEAQALYLSDADLNLVTMNFVLTAHVREKSVPVRMILNNYASENRTCELYPKTGDLIVDLIRSARAGKKLFVACNSKRRAKVLARVLAKELGASERVLLITADEKVNQDVQDFLEDIPAKYQLYQAVVASPAIGTGIDITFPDGAQEVDVVYGFFNSGINSHYDVDQQLGRVRNPGAVKVWVCSRRNHFETELDAIKLDLVQTGDSHPAVRIYSRGVPQIDMDHPLLALQANAYAAHRASQNRMRHYFVRHKERNGWTIKVVEPPESEENWALARRLKRTQREIDEEFIGGVMNASEIGEHQWKAYFDRVSAGARVGQLVIYEMVRFELRNFYNDYVTPEMVEKDDYRRFRESVMRYEALHIHTPGQLALLTSKWRTYREKGRDLSETLGNQPLRSMEAILLASGLLDDTGLRGDKVVTMTDMAGFISYCDKRRITVERDLDVSLREDRHRDPVKTLNLCLGQVGLRLLPLGKNRKGNVTSYRYQLDAVDLDYMRRLAINRLDQSRSTLPEVLQPPRAPARRKPANDNGGIRFAHPWLKSA